MPHLNSVTLILFATLLIVAPAGLQLTAGAEIEDFAQETVVQTSSTSSQSYILINPRYYQVKYTHLLENTSTSAVPRQDLWCPVPTSIINQRVSNVAFSPQPTEFLVDNWGQEVAHYVITNMPGKSTLEISWTVRLEISDVSFQIDPAIDLNDIPADIVQTYTADDEKYVLTNPVVQQAAIEAIGEQTTLYGMVVSIYDYVIDHLYYLKEAGWDDAATVLTKGSGSCSEYSFVFSALCRANGIPTRLVGGSRNRGAGGDYVDTVFHRAVEVYLPGYGWVPVDADLGDTKNRDDYLFKRYNSHFIIQSSGGRSDLLRWDYRSRLNVADSTLVTRSAQWTVIEPNHPPVFNAISNKSVNEGVTLNFTIAASDPDGDALTYSASNLPPGATFDPMTQTFSWMPGYDQSGTYTGIRFEVSDSLMTDWEDITITVSNVIRPDVNGDSSVNVLDLIRIGQRWNETGPVGWIQEDINEDGTVNILDATVIGQHWTG